MLAGLVVLCALPGAGPVYAGIAARDPALDAQAERVAIAVGQALEKKADATDLGSPPLPDPVDGADSVLLGAVAAARAKYLEGDFAAAAAKADEAVLRFEGGGAFRPGAAGASWTGYAEALVVRALALRRLGREAESDAALTALIAVMPKAVPDKELLPPKMLARYAQLGDELRGKPRVTIEVQSTPTGAEVTVDGVTHGKAPLVISDLLPGTHFIGLAAEGERAEKKIKVDPGGTARVDEKVGDPRAAAARALRTSLASPVSTEALLERAADLGDDVVAGALLPDGDGTIVILARVKGGAVSVTGARIDKRAQIKARVDALVDAVVAQQATWVGEGPKAAPAEIMAGGAGGAVVVVDPPPGEGEREGDGDEGDGTLVIVGVTAGVLAIAAAAAVVGVVLSAAEANKLKVTVDASKL